MPISSIVVRQTGLNKTIRGLNRLIPSIKKAGKGSVNTVGKAVRDVAKSFAPKDEGHLINAIVFEPATRLKGYHAAKIVSYMPRRKNWQGRIVPYNIFINDERVQEWWGTRKGTSWRKGYMKKAFKFAEKEFPKYYNSRIFTAVAGTFK